MDQNEFHKLYMQVALNLAEMSKSRRLKVGCAIAKDNRLIVTSYNGSPEGWDNDLEDGKGCTKDHIIHAEMNAIVWAAREGISLKGSTVYVTHEPCALCTALLNQAKVTNIYYCHKYESVSRGKSIHSTPGMTIIQLDITNCG